MSDAQRLIETLNAAWLANDLTTVRACYHPDAVLLPPDAGVPIAGRDEIVASYEAFSQQAELKDFRVTEMLTYEIDDLCAVHMRFDVDYRLNDADYQETGLEVYWLNATPVILWRYQLV